MKDLFMPDEDLSKKIKELLDERPNIVPDIEYLHEKYLKHVKLSLKKEDCDDRFLEDIEDYVGIKEDYRFFWRTTLYAVIINFKLTNKTVEYDTYDNLLNAYIQYQEDNSFAKTL